MKATKILTLLCVITFTVTACKPQNEPYNPGSQPTNNSSISVTTSAITGIWKVSNTYSNRSSQQSYYDSFKDFYLCFEADGTYNYYFETMTGANNYHDGESEGTKYLCRMYGYWKVNNNTLQMNRLRCLTLYENGHYTSMDVTGAESLSNRTISKLTSTEFDFLDLGGSTFYCTKAYSLPSKYNTIKSYDPYGTSGGGGGSSQGVTSLYLYDYTEWPTKIKVIYKYESDVNVTSAKIYYGEYSASSSVSATVSSTTITATISGLKKNTVYYVKASATTSKGTVYSSESRISTAIE